MYVRLVAPSGRANWFTYTSYVTGSVRSRYSSLLPVGEESRR
ncbi:hypothetical protein [Streptomyces spinoverrucosus]|nr:hypothetical protein [Streptomyces spinoverrucosus]